MGLLPMNCPLIKFPSAVYLIGPPSNTQKKKKKSKQKYVQSSARTTEEGMHLSMMGRFATGLTWITPTWQWTVHGPMEINTTPHKSISMFEPLSVPEAYEFWVEEHPRTGRGNSQRGFIHADNAGDTVCPTQSTNQTIGFHLYRITGSSPLNPGCPRNKNIDGLRGGPFPPRSVVIIQIEEETSKMHHGKSPRLSSHNSKTIPFDEMQINYKG